MDKTYEECVVRLIVDIVMCVVRDYQKALYRYSTTPSIAKRANSKKMIAECELFFRKNMRIYCDLDGEKIIRTIRKTVDEDLENKKNLKNKGIPLKATEGLPAQDRKKVEALIANAPYPESDIIRYRIIYKMTWQEIGDKVGYERSRAAKKFWNYVNNTTNLG